MTMTALQLHKHLSTSAAGLRTVAKEFNLLLLERDVKRNQVARALNIDLVKMHHFANGRMLLDERETANVIAWMTQ